jgi:proton-translocating NAD(P)+ transhydrogenase subunit alpha
MERVARERVREGGTVQEGARLTAGVPRETFPGETRVALTPAALPDLARLGIDVVVESGAGLAAGSSDAAFAEHGARIGSRDEAFACDVILQVRAAGANPSGGAEDLDRARRGSIVVGLAAPLDALAAVLGIAERGVTLFALDMLPRIARAQSMDVLSSQSTIAGYRAAVIAAGRLPKLFPMLTTAAGTIPAARVLVLGAGVAGMQAMATSHRLGALVEGYDVRPAAREDVESVGGRFVELPLAPGDAEDAGGYAKSLEESFYTRQQSYIAQVAAGADVVICAAAIPGRRAPLLLTAEAVGSMAPGSVVVDVVAERGGNCELTRSDEEVVVAGVTVLGPTNLAATVPREASAMFSRNVTAFLRCLVRDGAAKIDLEDEIIRETLVARDGRIVHRRVLEQMEAVRT